MKEISSGFVILNKNNNSLILACQAFGHKFKVGNCDVPKGHVEENESHLDAAKRELKEETGIVLTNEKIHDCGLFQYLPYKDLHLYLVEADVDVTKLSCNSLFTNRFGKEVPEIIGYHWVTGTNMFYRSLGPIVEKCIEHYKQGLV
jgi:predicted NUDIX family NTP pyrophosphohydrolase